jgi:dipeptidyl-peptidase-4
MKKIILFFSILLIGNTSLPAQKLISVENIWQDYTFLANSVPGFNFQSDGRHYTRLEANKIEQYDLLNGQKTNVLFDPLEVSGSKFDGIISKYFFSDDESKLLIKTDSEPIYRRSSKAKFFVYYRKEKSINSISDNKIQSATFNPQADKVAYVYQNNLYVKDLSNNKTTQITRDGEKNKIINGVSDWVYEEEFKFTRAFQWSVDGSRIAFYRFDESNVPEFTYTNYHDDMYPEYVTFNYPQAGEKNAEVSIHIYDTKSGTTIPVPTQVNEGHYIPRIKWTQDPDKLCVTRLNRHQNQLELLLVEAKTGKTSLLLKEKNKYYLNIHDNLTFLKNKKQFIWTSEMDGFNHIYLYNMKGKLDKQITKGHWEVTNFYGLNEKKGLVYYQSTENSPLERQVYSISLQGKRKQTLAGDSGWNTAQFNTDFDYYVVTHSTSNTPDSYTVYDDQARKVRVIEDNADLLVKQQQFGIGDVEFFNFETSGNVDLNGWMIKPAHFNENRQYPVFMYLYGGPGSQKVTDKWMGQNYWWFQLLAQKGYLVVCVDNRGTGGRGEQFKKMTYLQLGKYETIDQIEAAKYLGELPYTDAKRIGIFGWSYGGYMSSLCLFKGNDVFKAAIAVAPVTNWKWYDSVYTERYMRTPKENPDGYRDNSPIYFADQMKGNYLLVHGLGDDNVHFQNTAEITNSLIKANKQFDTYFYPNKNHSITGGTARLHLYTKMTKFLEDKLKGAPTRVMRNKGPMKVVPRDQMRSKVKKRN